jgi:hypothetical protein
MGGEGSVRTPRVSRARHLSAQRVYWCRDHRRRAAGREPGAPSHGRAVALSPRLLGRQARVLEDDRRRRRHLACCPGVTALHGFRATVSCTRRHGTRRRWPRRETVPSRGDGGRMEIPLGRTTGTETTSGSWSPTKASRCAALSVGRSRVLQRQVLDDRRGGRKRGRLPDRRPWASQLNR